MQPMDQQPSLQKARLGRREPSTTKSLPEGEAICCSSLPAKGTVRFTSMRAVLELATRAQKKTVGGGCAAAYLLVYVRKFVYHISTPYQNPCKILEVWSL